MIKKAVVAVVVSVLILSFIALITLINIELGTPPSSQRSLVEHGVNSK